MKLLLSLSFVFVHVSAYHNIINFKPAGGGLGISFQGFRGSLNITLGVGKDIWNRSCGTSDPKKHCFKVADPETNFEITEIETGVSSVSCHEVIWHNPSSEQEDCISLNDTFWYGGAVMQHQHWPIRNMSLPRVPYVSGDFAHNPLGGILDNLWFNSEGYSIFVDRNTPLFIRFNDSTDNKFCLSASYDEYPYSGASVTKKSAKELKYTYCSAGNIKESFQFGIGRWIESPTSVIDPKIITLPIWSTWARYPRDINSEVLEKFAQEIVDNGFKASHFEIDDMWETCYGELEFNTTKFPNIAETVLKIKSHGFNVSLWVHPYLNTDCPSFSDSKLSTYLIKNESSGKPLVCTWWNGDGGYLDATNQEATDYFISKLEGIRNDAGIDSFKFDSGEVEYISKGFVLKDVNVMATMNNFTRLYVNTAARMGNGVEVRVAYNSQNLPIFVRMLDKDSRWDYTNGLQTLIPTALHMSVIGLPFILPDMIGGNNYAPTGTVDKELFIRWLQINTFMPALQFSLVPWDFDEETVTITKAMVELHEQYAPVINKLAEEAVRTGNPIVRPLWWIAPNDPDALEAEQQFLLGDNILVAPVVEKGAKSRDIYIPEGIWEDSILQKTRYTGPIWLKNYSAQLNQLPYFTLLPSSSSSIISHFCFALLIMIILYHTT